MCACKCIHRWMGFLTTTSKWRKKRRWCASLAFIYYLLCVFTAPYNVVCGSNTKLRIIKESPIGSFTFSFAISVHTSPVFWHNTYPLFARYVEQMLQKAISSAKNKLDKHISVVVDAVSSFSILFPSFPDPPLNVSFLSIHIPLPLADWHALFKYTLTHTPHSLSIHYPLLHRLP